MGTADRLAGPSGEVQSSGAEGFHLDDPGRFANGHIADGQPRRKDQEPFLENLSKRIITDLRAFDAGLKKRDHDDFCLDMDLSPQDENPLVPISYQEARPRFIVHIVQIEAIAPELHSGVLDLTAARLNGMVAYYDERERIAKGEPKTEYKKLFKAVNDYDPYLIPEPHLKDTRKELIDYLEAVGHRPASDSPEHVSEAMRAYHEANKLTTPKDILEEYWHQAKRYRGQLSQIVGKDLSYITYDTPLKYKNAFWRMYERLSAKEKAVWLNWNLRHRESYDISVAQMYSIHEDKHIVIGTLYQEQIDAGELDPLAGLIPIPGPDSYALEGIAVTIQELAGYRLTDDSNLGTTAYYLSKIAIANGIYRVEEGEPVQDVAQNLAPYMPSSTVEDIEADLKEATQTVDPGQALDPANVMDRVYQPVYGLAGYEFLQISRHVSEIKKREFIKRFLKTPRSRDQIHDLANVILFS